MTWWATAKIEGEWRCFVQAPDTRLEWFRRAHARISFERGISVYFIWHWPDWESQCEKDDLRARAAGLRMRVTGPQKPRKDYGLPLFPGSAYDARGKRE